MRKIIGILVVFSILGYFVAFACAQSDPKAKLKAMKPKDYPTQPIELVVDAPAGGGMDVTARLIAKYLEQYIENRCLVINKAGGTGLIGQTYLASQAKNDGYSVGIMGNNFLFTALLRAQGKWTYNDVEPLAFINEDPVTWIVLSTGPLKDKSAKEVIDMARQKPGGLKITTAPDMHFGFLNEQVQMISGAKFVSVPFQGGKPAVVAMLGGHVDIATAFLVEYKGYLETGQVKVIGATGAERSVYFPNVPTFNEVLGVNNVLWSIWRFACVPKGVPRDRFRYLETAIDAALRDPGLVNDFNKMGSKIGLKYMNAKETSDEYEKQYKAFEEFFIKAGRISK